VIPEMFPSTHPARTCRRELWREIVFTVPVEAGPTKDDSMKTTSRRGRLLRRVLALALAVPPAVVGLAVVIPGAVAQAATQTAALDWARSKIGTFYDQDGVLGSQCVDLVRGYYVFFGKSAVAGNARDYAYNAVPVGFTRYPIANAPGGLKPGDVFVSVAGTYGHVGIVESVTNNSNFVSIDANVRPTTNSPTNSAGHNVNPVKRVAHSNYALWGVIRPSFDPDPVSTFGATVNTINWYQLINKASNKAVDVSTGTATNGSIVHQWTSHTGDNQKWQFVNRGSNNGPFYEVLSRTGSNQALDVKGVGTADGTQIQTWGYAGGANQQWRFVDKGNGWYELHPMHALGKCLDVNGASSADGAKIQIYTCNGTGAQLFTLRQAAGTVTGATVNTTNWYQLINKSSNKAVDVSTGTATNGSIVHQWTSHTGNNQKWQFVNRGSNNGPFYEVLSRTGSNQALDVKGVGTADGTQIQTWGYAGGANQQWRFVDKGNGWYELHPMHALGKCLDVNGASSADGAKIQIYTCNGTGAQLFTLRQA